MQNLDAAPTSCKKARPLVVIASTEDIQLDQAAISTGAITRSALICR